MADGRIGQPDVQAAVSVRMAYAQWGQAPAKPLPAATRAAVFAVKGNRCVSCGAPATDVDHVVSAAFGDNSLDNLQPFCHACHLEKTLDSPMPWDTRNAVATAIHDRLTATYEERVRANPPLRACDDELTWPSGWRAVKWTREVARAGDQPDADLRALLELIASGIQAGDSLGSATAEAESALGLSRKRRRVMMRRLRELAIDGPV
jgi:5-methylcytosine-specific restriction endonuclease McrA